MKNKCTLLIDGNWLCMSRMAVIGRGFEMDMPDHVKERAKKDLHELMAKSIAIVLNRFNIIDNVILVTDGGSWRKQLPVPQQLQNVTYKGNRAPAKELDWKYIYGALTDLSEQCKVIGMTVSNHSSIEGDDWIWYWSRRLNADGTSCIIWSSDNDLKQLIQTNTSTIAFTAWYNDRNGVWLDSNYNEEPEDDLEFFMRPMRVKSPLLENLRQFSRTTSFINPDDIVMEKIICGDAGDNIKPIARVACGSKTYKVSPKMWNEVKESLNINNLSDFFTHKNDIITAVLSIKKFVDCNYEDLSEMFDYNIKLVWLHESVVPETIIMYMNQLEYNVVDTNYIKSNFKTMCKAENEIESIFESVADEFAPF